MKQNRVRTTQIFDACMAAQTGDENADVPKNGMTDPHNEICFRKEFSIVRHGELWAFQVKRAFDTSNEALRFRGRRKVAIHILNQTNLLIVCQLAALVFEYMNFWMIF